jgi:hypothetical protein
VERRVTETVHVMVPVLQIRMMVADSVKVFDIDGNKLELKDVADLLARPRPVLISAGGKLDPFYRRLFQMGTLVLVPAEAGAVPGIPVVPAPLGPAPPPRPIPAPR